MLKCGSKDNRVAWTLLVATMVFFCITESAEADGYPVRFSWADYWDDELQDWVNYVTPVRHDQILYGQCQVMSAAAAMEAQIIWRLGKPDSNVNVSEQMAISCYSDSAQDCNAYFRHFWPHAIGSGVPTESCLPYYVTENCDEPLCSSACDWPLAWASIIDEFIDVPTDAIETGPFGPVALKPARVCFRGALPWTAGPDRPQTGTGTACHLLPQFAPAALGKFLDR